MNEEYIQKEVIPMLVSRTGEDLCMIVIKNRNVPGVWAKVCAVAAENNVNILAIIPTRAKPHAPERGSMVVTRFIFEMATSRISAEELAKRIKELPVIEDAWVAISPRKYLVDSISFPITSLGEPAVILPISGFAELEEGIKRLLKATVPIRLAARKPGEMLIKKVADITGLSGEELIRLFLGILQATGWGRFNLSEFDTESCSGRISVEESAEAKYRKAKEPLCVFLRGILEGALTEALGVEIRVEEKACAGAGAAHCEFHFAPRS